MKLTDVFQLADKAIAQHMEDDEALEAAVDEYLKHADLSKDFPEDSVTEASPAAQYARELAQKYITDKTREGHLRCVFLHSYTLYLLTSFPQYC